ncbi:50S ribosomal subunit protein L21 [Candidatus Magnetomoraceae bacterium gMMP-15]
MYAVIASGGKQYKVNEGQTLKIEKISGEAGTPVSFDNVLLYSDGDDFKIGQPFLEDVRVNGHIVEQGKAKKILVFKYKKRKRFRKKQGHRQPYTAFIVDSINQI